MGWNDQQNGRFGGNAPHPNDTAAQQDYVRGQNERRAADEAAARARSASLVPSWTPASTPSYTAPSTSSTYTTPSYSSPSYTPSSSSSSSGSSSYVSSGGAGRSMAGSHLNNVYELQENVFRPESWGNISDEQKTPWVAISMGLLFGAGLAVLPFAIRANFHHSFYLDRMVFSMAVFSVGVFWAIAELTRGRFRIAVATALLGFFVPEAFWFQTGSTFLHAYSRLLTGALDHIGR